MSRQVVVTGGAGFIGSALIRDLREDGCEVFVIDNLSCGRREHLEAREQNFFCLDILDAKAVERTIHAIDPEWAIHLAAIHFIPYCNAHPRQANATNLLGTINVLDALRGSSKLAKVFFASTAAVYADCAGPVAETSAALPLDIYGQTKFVGERLMRDFHRATEIPCVIGRLFNAYGPRETNPHLIPEILRQVMSGRRRLELGNVATRRDYLHTADMARAILLLMRQEETDDLTYNIGSGSSHTARDVVGCFARAIGHSLEIEVASDRVREHDRAVLEADISKIRRAVGWGPTISLQEGIEALCRQKPVERPAPGSFFP